MKSLAIALLLLPLAVAAGPAGNGLPPAWPLLASAEEGGTLSAAEVAEIVTSQYGGQVLSITESGGDQPEFRVKLLTDDGVVKVLRVDGTSGAVSE